MNVAIITARAGSKSILDKNVLPLADHPLISYPIRAAQEACRVDRVFVSTDGPAIASASEQLGATVLWRPEELCGDHINHGDVIKHAVEVVDREVDDLENVVLLLGNTVMVDGDLIDDCLECLGSEPRTDSVMTVWEAADDHPYRALEVVEGFVRSSSVKPADVSTERQSYPTIYYYDQGVWAFRKTCVFERRGPAPWWWMGERCRAIARSWVTGRDIHTEFDVLVAEHYVRNREAFREHESRRLLH